MSTHQHTPGPLVPGALNPLTDRLRICRVYENKEFTTTNGIGYKFVAECDNEANARLIAASYTAFDSAANKLGLNAVEFAERMCTCGIADLAECLRDILSRFRSCIAQGNGEIEGDKDAIERACNVLAKVKGGAV